MKKQKYITSVTKKETVDKDEFISIVLLCDTPGYRMKSYGAIPLIPLQRHKLIDIQINVIDRIFPQYEIIICVGYDADKVCKYVKNRYRNCNIRIVENQIYETSNSCEGVRLCLNNITNDKVLIFDGSLIIHPDTFSEINTNKSYIVTESDFFENLEIGVNIGENGAIEHFGFGAHNPWSEIIYLNNEGVIDCLRKIISNENFKQKFLFEGLNELIKTKHKIEVINNKHPIKKINNIKTYHKLRGVI